MSILVSITEANRIPFDERTVRYLLPIPTKHILFPRNPRSNIISKPISMAWWWRIITWPQQPLHSTRFARVTGFSKRIYTPPVSLTHSEDYLSERQEGVAIESDSFGVPVFSKFASFILKIELRAVFCSQNDNRSEQWVKDGASISTP
ncbi:hypothetical protein [Vreelandella utahensis]|uniref:hypothetical protein n=1 Tax=Vreelandella halophila TaxID=86177 RepID=UPI00117A42DE|nr:hypothetical protein [Halomonas utahensis]